MNNRESRILFTALAFITVVLREDLSEANQSTKITELAKLIESYCKAEVPGAFEQITTGENEQRF